MNNMKSDFCDVFTIVFITTEKLFLPVFTWIIVPRIDNNWRPILCVFERTSRGQTGCCDTGGCARAAAWPRWRTSRAANRARTARSPRPRPPPGAPCTPLQADWRSDIPPPLHPQHRRRRDTPKGFFFFSAPCRVMPRSSAGWSRSSSLWISNDSDIFLFFVDFLLCFLFSPTTPLFPVFFKDKTFLWWTVVLFCTLFYLIFATKEGFMVVQYICVRWYSGTAVGVYPDALAKKWNDESIWTFFLFLLKKNVFMRLLLTKVHLSGLNLSYWTFLTIKERELITSHVDQISLAIVAKIVLSIKTFHWKQCLVLIWFGH